MTTGASHGMPYRIVTERAVVRAYEVADAEAMASVMQTNHERLREWLPWAWDEPQELDTRRNLMKHFRSRFESGEDFTMGIFDRQSGDLLGGTGLHPRGVENTLEIGYWLAADAVGKGLMQEVAGALTWVALGLGLSQRVEIRCDPMNTRSGRVPASIGYVLEDTRVDTCGSTSQRTMTEIWAIDAERLAVSPIAALPRPSIFDAAGHVMGRTA